MTDNTPGVAGTMPAAAAQLQSDGHLGPRGSMGVLYAYVLIQAEVGTSAQVAEAIRRIQGVESASDVVGPYDIIARVTAPGMDELGKLVITRVQDVDGVIRTLTCTVTNWPPR